MRSQDEATCSPVDEIQGIKIKAAKLRKDFTSVLMHTKICFMEKEVEESGKFLRAFRVTLTSLSLFKQHEDKDFLKEEKNRINKAKNVDEIFEILDPYWNYVDYDFLEHIINELGTSELKEEMKEYIVELERYEKKTTVHDFSLATQGNEVVPAHYMEMAVKLKKDPKSFTLHDVRQFKKSVEDESSLKEYGLLFRRVSCSSVEIILAFPPEAHAKLLEVFKNRQFRRKHMVVSEDVGSLFRRTLRSSRQVPRSTAIYDEILSLTSLPAPEEEEGDQTGDSGIGTGSGTTKYGTVEEWKEAIQNPPPDTREHCYQSLMRETTDTDQPYQVLTTRRRVNQDQPPDTREHRYQSRSTESTETDELYDVIHR